MCPFIQAFDIDPTHPFFNSCDIIKSVLCPLLNKAQFIQPGRTEWEADFRRVQGTGAQCHTMPAFQQQLMELI